MVLHQIISNIYSIFADWENHHLELIVTFLPPVVYWAYCSIYAICDKIDSPFLDKYRVNKIADRSKNNVTLQQVIIGVLIQQLIQIILTLISIALGANQPWLVNVPIWGKALQFIAAMIIIDCWEYWIHRWMHINKFLYRNIHASHHRLVFSYAFGALYSNPIESLLLDTLGGVVAVVASGMDMDLATLFICLSTMKTIDDHSGYTFPFNPFHRFRNNSKYHDYHHKIPMSNFSQPYFTFWDVLCGTDYEIREKKKINK